MRTKICDALKNISSQDSPNHVYRNGNYVNGNFDIIIVNDAINVLESELDKYRESLVELTSSENRNIDAPVFYDFKHLMSSCFDFAIKDSAVGPDKMNEYVSTLKLRMQSFADDIRLASPLMLDKQENINNSLVQFLAYVLGDYCDIYKKDAEDDNIYNHYYGDSKGDNVHSQITIIDMSLLPFQVLETITGLIGRIILEFLSRFEKSKRGSIAREGRKYGLSLLVSSQRPSELSKTVLSQCNSFIVHRIQNPDDQVYIRKLVSSANSEILNQLPTLPQQHVIVMGDCVRTPVVAKMNTASPEFIQNWLKEERVDYQGVANKWIEIESKNTENNNK